MVQGKKHLSLLERKQIEDGLNKCLSLGSIARLSGKSTSTIQREIARHAVTVASGAYGRPHNTCVLRKQCQHYNICVSSPACKNKCSLCNRCNSVCPDFKKEECSLLKTSPHVCNGCEQRRSCTLEKKLYKAVDAQKAYESVLRKSRSGFNLSDAELCALDSQISPLIWQGQSIGAIVRTHRDDITHSESTIRRLVREHMLAARKVDLPRTCRLKLRKGQKRTLSVDRECKKGRTYEEFFAYTAENPDIPIVQADSVIGEVGGKVLHTYILSNCNFMIARLHDRNTAASVAEDINEFERCLTRPLFVQMFPIVLADNGSEFSNPAALELDKDGRQRLKLFYCNAGAPYEKGKIENSHTLIRRILPKGTSFNSLAQKDIDLMMSHINSYGRGRLNWRSPTQVFCNLYGEEALHLLGQEEIPADKIVLKPILLKK